MSDHVGNRSAQGDGQNNHKGLDTALYGHEQPLRVQGGNIKNADEQAVHEDARNHGNDGRDGYNGPGGAKAAGKLEPDDADEGCPPKGGPGHGNIKADCQDIPRADGHDGADAGDGQQARRDIEDDGKPHGRQCCGDGLRTVNAVRHDVVRRIGRNLAQADGPDDTEGHSQDNEHRVHGPGHARYDVVVHEVVKGVDERHARHEKQHAGNHGKPWRCRSRQYLRPIGRSRRDARRRGNADVRIDAEAVAAVAHPEADAGSQGRIDKGNPVAAE